MKTLLQIVVICFSLPGFAQSSDELAIRKLLSDQTKFWNEGSIEQFVQGYWHHDSLMFIGQNGVTYGFENMLNNYKRNYSDTTKMGKLSFDILKVQRLSADYFFVVGKWFLARSVGNLQGHYTLILRKINNQWVIVADHSS